MAQPVEIIRRHAHVPPPSLRQKVPMISPAIEEIIFTALAKDPTKRFVNYLIVYQRIEREAQIYRALVPTCAHLKATRTTSCYPSNSFHRCYRNANTSGSEL